MTKTTQTNSLRNMVLAALFLALCLLLPFLTGQIPEIGNLLLPMHFPVFLCGFVCGWPWGLAVGLAAPLLRSVVFGMPPLMPTALAMAFELAAYGLFAGILYRLLPKKPAHIWLALVLAMIGGRLVWGLASLGIYSLLGTPFTLEMFLAGGITGALPGIVAQLVLLPPIVLALQRTKQISL